MSQMVDEMVGDKMLAMVAACHEVDGRFGVASRPLRGLATAKAGLYVAAAGILGMHGVRLHSQLDEDLILDDMVDLAIRTMTEYLRRKRQSRPDRDA